MPVRLSATLRLFYPTHPLFLSPLLSSLYLSALSPSDIPIISATIFSTFVRTSFYIIYFIFFLTPFQTCPFFFFFLKALMMVGVRSAPTPTVREKKIVQYTHSPLLHALNPLALVWLIGRLLGQRLKESEWLRITVDVPKRTPSYICISSRIDSNRERERESKKRKKI